MKKRLKNSLLAGYYSVLKKKNTNNKKIQKNYCQARKSPYNAPPLTDAERRHAAEDSERKAKISA
ncbi:hypothetical protein KKJ09_17935, partial [Xenorhabdus bovienii]|nr:hypothetical protein [Xenorhabdus bovienii]MDE9503806.1 hypothetical protein [Xenorhabdus bovienii]MDE9527555.1 hypothetical protein [Xenorhabdus bovienii]MDE9570715.1 hypothetical protein [Xenorhabdus bovienii]